MRNKIEYKELVGLTGSLSTPVTRKGLARIIVKANAGRRSVKKVSTGYIIEGVIGELREFSKREG